MYVCTYGVTKDVTVNASKTVKQGERRDEKSSTLAAAFLETTIRFFLEESTNEYTETIQSVRSTLLEKCRQANKLKLKLNVFELN